jgi:hypothetical protein
MDVNGDKMNALAFAHVMWILAAALPYLSTPGTALFSFSAMVLIFGGVLVAGPLFGLGFHGVRSRIGKSLVARPDGPGAPGPQTIAMVGVLLTLLEVIVILVIAAWSFRQVETARAGYPIEYATDRTGFNAAIATFANANQLAEETKLARETGKTDSEKETQLITMIEDGLKYGGSVSDPFLAYLDPELPERYRTQLVRGFEMMLEGRRTNDPATEAAGNTLVRQFYTEYMPARVDTILRRMGSEAAPP